MRALLGLLIVLLFSPDVHAADLTKIERTIAKEPAYAGKPKYCLLVFGLEAKTRIWLALDGDKLYVDRNGNGDLTDDGPPVAAKVDGDFRLFNVPEIQDGRLVHKYLCIETFPLSLLAATNELARDYSIKHPHALGFKLMVALEMPGRVGAAPGGLVNQLTSSYDDDGVFQFSESPAAAPIIHFGGPWSLLVPDRIELRVGREAEFFAAIGTRGLGPGTTALIEYEKLVPNGLPPTVDFTFAPQAPGAPPVRAHYELKERCCTVNLHGLIAVPESAGVGTAKARLAFETWEFGLVAPSEQEFSVVAPPSGPKLEAVSRRLLRSLQHPTRNGSMYGLRYSPDGRRLVAGNYESGVIQFWDADTGRQLTHIDVGPNNISLLAGPPLSSNWSILYAANGSHPNYTRVERDGKVLFRWEFDGAIRLWDVATGTLRDEWRHDPPRREMVLYLSPDGRSLLSTEQLPGEMTTPQVARAASLWDVTTKQRRELPRLESFDAIFSPDSRLIAMARLTSAADAAEAIKVIDSTTMSVVRSIPIEEKNTIATLSAFTPDGRVIVATTRTLTNLQDRKSWKYAVRFWDVQSGAQILNEPIGPTSDTSHCRISPDGTTFIVPGWSEQKCLLHMFDVTERRLRQTLDLDTHSLISAVAFSPDCRWLAVVTRFRPENTKRDIPPEELAQPRIHLIDVSSGQVRETLVAPQAIPESACFSPDGKTLATGGRGKVHLWDVSDLK